MGADGQAIFALLMEEHGKEGAVPREVEIEHYVRAGREGQEAGVVDVENGVRSRYPLKGSAAADRKGDGGGGAGNKGEGGKDGREEGEVESGNSGERESCGWQ